MTQEELVELYNNATSRDSLTKLVFGYSNGHTKKKLFALYESTGLDLEALNLRVGSANIKYSKATKICPVCTNEFITIVDHRDEKTTCSFACSNTHFRSGENNANWLGGKRGVAKSANAGKTRGQIRKEYLLAHPDIAAKVGADLASAGRKHYKENGVSEETRKKISESAIARVQNGTHKGWKVRNQPSYPEKFWMEILKNNGIDYTFELKQAGYFIDFAIMDKKIALEIDGKQHELPERKASDARKDEYLASQGWSVYRIKWKSLNNEAGKAYIKQEIDNFVAYYNNTDGTLHRLHHEQH